MVENETRKSLSPLSASIADGALLNWAGILALGIGDIVALDFMERIFAAKVISDRKLLVISRIMAIPVVAFVIFLATVTVHPPGAGLSLFSFDSVNDGGCALGSPDVW